LGDKGTPAEYSECLALAIERDWLVMHESGTFAKFVYVAINHSMYDLYHLDYEPDGRRSYSGHCYRNRDCKRSQLRPFPDSH
jgi:hypothetical protein